MNLTIFENQIFFTTVRIAVQKNTGDGSSVGTGFLVRSPIPRHEGQFAILLVSNKHVYHDPKQPVEMALHARGKVDPNQPDFTTHKVFKQNNFSGRYAEHPNAKVDIACTNVSFINDPKHGIYWKALPIEMCATFTEPQLKPGKDVWFIGYPENRFDTAHNLPILRVGHIASVPGVDFNGEPQFLIDAQVFPGSSGSPVFVLLGTQYRFLGVVSRVMIKDEKIQTITTASVSTVQQVLGLGIVFKATQVKELVDMVVEQIAVQLDQKKPEPTVGPNAGSNPPIA